MADPHVWLEFASVAPEVFTLRPDYRAMLLVVRGLAPGPSDAASDAMLVAAEEAARARLATIDAPERLPELAAWREAYRAFGAKPQRTRPSVEALVRRVPDGLPRIDRITDAYNAVSVRHLLPLGGEDLDTYAGSARLVRADGTEPFEILSAGEPTTEHPVAGEVVWRDDKGVTCRRWNWRQSRRTAITAATTNAVFILDGLGQGVEDELAAAADELEAALGGTDAARRLIAP